MNYTELFEALMLQLGYKPSAQQIADIIGLSRQSVYTRSQRPEQNFTLEELLKIEQALNVDLVNKSLKMDNIRLVIPPDKELNGKGRFFKIPYWSGPSAELIKKYGVDDLNVDLQLIINDWHTNPEHLVFIAMPGDDMDGGDYPIKNKDILVIDTNRNNMVESGIYFCTTHGHSRVYVRRIIEKMTDEIVCVTTVDNPRYKSIIEKKWTEEAWKAADVQVIGRVIKNMSYTI